MFTKILNTVEHALAFGALVLFLFLIGASDAHAQSVWDQCTDGRSITKCETYDCPMGDTNSDGSCSLDDDNARLTDVRNDSFCANPISGCGEVRYYGAGDNNSCSIRVEENSNNCDLYSVANPNFTPTPTATTKPTATPSAIDTEDPVACNSLIASKTSGESPLTVEFEVKASGSVSRISEYEFTFTNPDGQKSGEVIQSSSKLKQILKDAGTHTASVKIITKDGESITSGQCRKDIKVSETRAIGGGGTLDDNKELPETGSPVFIGIGLIFSGAIGTYLYDKYRFI